MKHIHCSRARTISRKSAHILHPDITEKRRKRLLEDIDFFWGEVENNPSAYDGWDQSEGARHYLTDLFSELFYDDHFHGDHRSNRYEDQLRLCIRFAVNLCCPGQQGVQGIWGISVGELKALYPNPAKAPSWFRKLFEREFTELDGNDARPLSALPDNTTLII